MNDFINKIYDLALSFLGSKDAEFISWTPSSREVQDRIKAFLEDERGWLASAIERDPALKSREPKEAVKELMTYQGLHAIAFHQQAHAKYEADHFAEARKISQGVRRLTAGIEIHPGATIGKNFFIDHGSGVVIGETAEIGDNVLFYHRVTLGNDGKRIENERRHPKIGDNSVIFTGAEILGPATIGKDVVIGAGTKVMGNVTIGDGAKIAPQLVISTDIPDGAKVIGSNQRGEPVFASNNSDIEYALGTHPAWQQRMRAEKDAYIAKKSEQSQAS